MIYADMLYNAAMEHDRVGLNNNSIIFVTG